MHHVHKAQSRKQVDLPRLEPYPLGGRDCFTEAAIERDDGGEGGHAPIPKLQPSVA